MTNGKKSLTKSVVVTTMRKIQSAGPHALTRFVATPGCSGKGDDFITILSNVNIVIVGVTDTNQLQIQLRLLHSR